MRDMGANVAPPPERRAESQTHKSRRGLGESRYRGTLGDPGASLGPPASHVTGELTALVGARVIGEHRHPTLVEQFTVLQGALSIFVCEILVDEMGFEPTTSSLRTGNH